MEYWEFLLQQEGDHHWLPLDTAQMEILEGRYRIMAHTSAANTPVRVQVSQRLLNQDPPKRRNFQRQGHTNDDGLMVVIPFTRLQAGTWDIRCSSLPTEGETTAEPKAEKAAAAAADWAYRIQLQVLPPGTGDDEDWALPPDELSTSVVTAAATPVALAPDPAPMATAQPNLDLDPIAAALDEAQADLATGDALQGGPYRLSLTQTALLGQEGAEVDLSGHVTGAHPRESCAGMTLVVRLVDPQTATAVALRPFPLNSPTLPADVHLTLTIPSHLKTRLLLGELALVDIKTVAVLALQRFTLTVDLADLFDTIANQAEAETDYILDFVGGSGAGQTLAGESRDEAFPSRPLDLPQGPPRSIPVLTRPQTRTPLPPKLYEPSPHEISARQPTLPPFGSQRRPTSAPNASFTDGLGADSPTPADSEDPPTGTSPTDPVAPSNPTGPDIAATLPSDPAQTSSPLGLPSLPPAPAADDSSAQPPTVPLLVSHEVAEFRDLNLQERFWSRLSEMAVSLQQEAKERREAAGGTQLGSLAPVEPFAGEVVIYDDEDETLGGAAAAPEEPVPSSPAEASESPITPPVPELEVPSGDLMAGELVALTLRVPFHPNRLYLKVWISDPQTRSLVDEPRQVMNLRPNGHGQLEGTVRVTAPLGCLEADFEAIAVDMITQQESYKATVRRSVVPLGLETSSLDEFEF